MKAKNRQALENLKEAYEAPTCKIIEIQQEGVLCQSGIHGGYDEEHFNW